MTCGSLLRGAGSVARNAQGRAVPRFATIVFALHAPNLLAALLFKAPMAEERPLFNLDLLLAAAIACFSTLGGAAALLLAWSADFVRSAAKNYHFMSAMDFMDAVRFVDMLNLRTFLSLPLIGSVAGLALCAWVVLGQARKRPSMAAPLLATIVLAAGFDVANGSFHIFGLDKDSRIIRMNFAGSPAWNVWRSEQQNPMASGLPVPMRDPVSFNALREWQQAHLGETSLLVLVESMGLPRSPELQAWLRGRLVTARLSTRWTIRAADEAFYGTTTSGELRTLCGLQGHYSRLDDKLAAGCLPHVLAQKGTASIGIHGFGLRMFDRNQWWPRVGLMPWAWREQPTGGLPMNCNHAFPGVCDAAVLELAVAQAQQPARFVYALTLDTHLPLKLEDSAAPSATLKVLCAASGTPEEACRLVQQLGDLLGLLGQALERSRATPFVVVVGDHAPPFGEAANRQAFVAGRVPLFVLTPI
ncbi:hypothetical protein [Pelomonas cellulosilytica]|uniref:Sulfatase N-terminal domain-containing protein n=1 Tax=Pelomonas cellulosilytica TaxID=2906762 RepID=A0ABS8Y183_9BURK|nr:hypothetical protein [Pelomonas sp. P8]MCE4558053.1 hypothetical protein [Pelomonas sp. P8]